MKIAEYNQMMQHLTKPGTPEQNKKAEENNRKYLADRKAKTLKSYGLTEKDLKPAAVDPQTLKPSNDLTRNLLIEESKSRDLSSEEMQYLMTDEKLTKKPTVEELVKKRSLNKRGLNTVVYDGSKDSHEPIKKKIIKPIKPQKIDPVISDPYSAIVPTPDPIDPKLKELEQKFLAAQEQNYQEKVKTNQMGLRSFAPIRVYRND